jgi:hypothetical protein
MTRAEAERFFTAYGEAFARLDGDAVADLWHVPSGIAQGVALTWWADEAPMRANHRALCEVYRRSGLARTGYTIAHHEALGADHAFVNVRWTLWRADGSVLQAFGTGYQLVRTPAGPKVLLCTAYEEDLKEMQRDAAVR